MRNHKQVFSGIILLILTLINVVIVKTAYTVNEKWYWALLIFIPLLLIAIKKQPQLRR
jgi:hypothetical protein